MALLAGMTLFVIAITKFCYVLLCRIKVRKYFIVYLHKYALNLMILLVERQSAE